MKYDLQDLLNIKKEELLKKLKETYSNYKLNKNQNIIARGIEILSAIIIIFSGLEWYYILAYLLIVIYGIYRLIKPNDEDTKYFEKFELLADEFENFKKFKQNKINVNINPEKVLKIEKSITKLLPLLIQTSGIGKFNRICAFIPIINIFIDEMSLYRNPKDSPLNILLYGNLAYASLEDFESSKVKEL